MKLFQFAGLVLMLTGVAGTTVHAQDSRLAWDYGVAPAKEVLCGAREDSKNCIQSFVIAYQTGKKKFKSVATVTAKDVCTARKEPGAGWTCSSLIPALPGKKQKVLIWVVWAVTASGVSSAPSNAVPIG